MVRTTKGEVGHSDKAVQDKTAPEKATSEDRKMERTLDLDDETWDRLVSAARNQAISPAEAVRRAMNQLYGQATPSGAVNSGLDTDPNRQ
jgi:hypothetical protein